MKGKFGLFDHSDSDPQFPTSSKPSTTMLKTSRTQALKESKTSDSASRKRPSLCSPERGQHPVPRHCHGPLLLLSTSVYGRFLASLLWVVGQGEAFSIFWDRGHGHAVQWKYQSRA